MRILYLEGDRSGAPYLSGTLSTLGVAHALVHPGGDLPHDLSSFQAVVLSGFSHAQLSDLAGRIVRAVRDAGMGLLMVGGSRSFGRGGFAGTPLGNLLPVTLDATDDRERHASGLLLHATGAHPILKGMPLDRAVAVCGLNRIAAREHTTTVLVGRPVEAAAEGVGPPGSPRPVLVVREAMNLTGRTAAFATGLNPPWSAGLIEWGEKLIATVDEHEVGEGYATLVMNLIRWVAGEETIRRPIPAWDPILETPAGREATASCRVE